MRRTSMSMMGRKSVIVVAEDSGMGTSQRNLGGKGIVGPEAGEDFVGRLFHRSRPRLECAVVKSGGAPSGICVLFSETRQKFLQKGGVGLRGKEIVSYRSAARNVTEGIP